MSTTAASAAGFAVLVGYLLLAVSLALPWIAMLSYRFTPLDTPVGWGGIVVVLLLALPAALAGRVRLPRVLWALPLALGSFLLGASLTVVGSASVLNEIAASMLATQAERALEMLNALAPAARLIGLDLARYRTFLQEFPGRFEITVLPGLWLFVVGSGVLLVAAVWKLGIELAGPPRAPTAGSEPAARSAGLSG